MQSSTPLLQAAATVERAVWATRATHVAMRRRVAVNVTVRRWDEYLRNLDY